MPGMESMGGMGGMGGDPSFGGIGKLIILSEMYNIY